MQKLYNCFEKSKEAMHEEYIYSLNTCDFVKRCVALFIANPMEKALVGEIKVRALVLKYSITSTLGEMYCANIKTPEKWKSHYDNVSNDSRAHYLWLLDTYYAMPSEMKENLKTIFENTHAWRLLNIATLLSDESTINDLVRVYKGAIIGSNRLPMNVRRALGKLLPYYYETFFKDYFEENAPKFEEFAKQMTEEAKEYPNPYQFVTENLTIPT